MDAHRKVIDAIKRYHASLEALEATAKAHEGAKLSLESNGQELFRVLHAVFGERPVYRNGYTYSAPDNARTVVIAKSDLHVLQES